MGKNILITGGSGFIGSHFVEKFVKENYVVSVIDMWESDEIKSLKKDNKLNFYKIENSDFKNLENIFKEHNNIIHLAAILGTSETITTYDVENVFQTNIIGTTQILKLAKKLNYRKVLVPTTPDVSWLNPYKISKNAIEKTCLMFNKEFDLNVTCMKLGNIYGKRERWLDNKMGAPFNYEKVIPTFLINTFRNKPIKIYGDGKQKSEYIFIDDVTESFFRAIENDINTKNDIIHIGSGENNSVLNIISELEKILNKTIKKEFVIMRPGEHFAEINLKPENLEKYYNYKLKFNLNSGLQNTIEYYRKAASE